MTPRQNIALVAGRLGSLLERVVFVGGATTELLLSDPLAGPVRPTDDVDLILPVASRLEFIKNIAEQLRGLGFKPDTREDAPACRWVVDGVTVDIMATGSDILGFSNRWYEEAVPHAIGLEIAKGHTVRVMSAPYFLATKLEAFKGRGNGDYLASADIEDVITLVDGRAELIREVPQASDALRKYLSDEISKLLVLDDFADAIEGFYRPGVAAQRRRDTLLTRLNQLAASELRTGNPFDISG